MINLYTHSISAKLYRWFYLESEMPQNLCAYFWKLVLGFVFSTPLFVLTLPTIVTNFISKNSEIKSFSERIAYSLTLWIVAAGIFSLAVALITFPQGILDTSNPFLLPQLVGYFLIVSSLIWGILWIAKFITNRVETNSFSAGEIENKSSVNRNILIVDYIKSKYLKHCPRINWVKK